MKPARTKFTSNTLKQNLRNVIPLVCALVVIAFLVYRYVDPAPPKKFIISAGELDSNYTEFAKQYKDIIKLDGIEVEVIPSKGVGENLMRLDDPKFGVGVGFVQDGLSTREKHPGLSSLGSLYYEPVWIFYRGNKEMTRLNHLQGKKIGVGERGGDAHAMAKKLLTGSGVTEENSKWIEMTADQEYDALMHDQIEAAFFVSAATNPVIKKLLVEPSVRLMSLDQAEALTRVYPYLHHLTLPHGTADLKNGLPPHDVELVSSTATLVVRDDLHPAIVYLLLKAAQKVHHAAGIFEKKHEFPDDKDYVFPLNAGAKNFYKSGAPFWLRYLPFWLATIAERFVYLILPLFAFLIPLVRTVPKYMEWRARNKIYQRYGELKFLEDQIKPESAREKFNEFIAKLDQIEERVNSMKVPLDFSDYVYVLREHIDFVRARLTRLLERADASSPLKNS